MDQEFIRAYRMVFRRLRPDTIEERRRLHQRKMAIRFAIYCGLMTALLLLFVGGVALVGTVLLSGFLPW
jgi:hypothetical protein